MPFFSDMIVGFLKNNILYFCCDEGKSHEMKTTENKFFTKKNKLANKENKYLSNQNAKK